MKGRGKVGENRRSIKRVEGWERPECTVYMNAIVKEKINKYKQK